MSPSNRGPKPTSPDDVTKRAVIPRGAAHLASVSRSSPPTLYYVTAVRGLSKRSRLLAAAPAGLGDIACPEGAEGGGGSRCRPVAYQSELPLWNSSGQGLERCRRCFYQFSEVPVIFCRFCKHSELYKNTNFTTTETQRTKLTPEQRLVTFQ